MNPFRRLPPTWSSVARRLGLAVGLLVAAAKLLSIFDASQAAATWLFPRYAGYWVLIIVFGVACLSSGNLVVTALSPRGYRADGHFVLSFATGVFAFFLAMFLGGILGAYGAVWFALAPLSLAAIGFPALLRWGREERRALTDAPPKPWTKAELLSVGLGAVALAFVYLPILNPENAAYDARWYHMGLAEHYAAAGRVGRFPEGVLAGAIPHLTSLIYAWAFLLPVGTLFDKVELCAHLEFLIFAAGLTGIPPLVRYLLPGQGSFRVAWVARFLFPSIFVYDTGLHTAADHVAAMWTIPVWLTLARAVPRLSIRASVLFAVQVSAILLAKYTAAIVVIGPILAYAGRAAWLLWRSPDTRRRLGAAVASCIGAGLLLTTPHWLKNWIWYGDPIYPILWRHLRERPWTVDSPELYARFEATNFTPTGAWDHKLRHALAALYDHSFALYNWADFHGTAPVVGSLFTFSLVALPFLTRTRRTWALVAAAHLGVFAWFYMSHQERYLQALVPWMAAALTAVMVLVWRQGGLLGRGALSALVAVQVAWGSDIPFYPTHKMHGQSGILRAAEFLARGYRRDKDRLSVFHTWAALGAPLPRTAKVLVHQVHGHLGIGRQTVTDSIPVQMGINYGRWGSVEAIYDQLRSFGVTHVAWQPGATLGADSIAGDILFAMFSQKHTVQQRTVDGIVIGAIPPVRPTSVGNAVAFFGCNDTYRDGLYAVPDLAVPVPTGHEAKYPEPRRAMSRTDAEEVLQSATFVVVETRCRPPSLQLSGFTQLVQRDGAARADLYLRTAGTAPMLP